MAFRLRRVTKFVPRPGGPFKDGATSGDLVDTQEIEYADDGPILGSPRVSSASGGTELGSAGKKFVGFGLILFGLWIAPESGASASTWLIPASLVGLGLFGLAKGTLETWGDGWHPFASAQGVQGFLLRLFWAFRPRAYMVVWAVVVVGFATIGTPHLRIQYGPAGCDYFGLNGWETHGSGSACPLFKLFRLPVVG